MAGIKRLSAVKVDKERRPGLYADGLGLYLQITPAGTKSWIYRYRVGSKLRDMGLGSIHAVSLAQARDQAAICRHQRANGIDPIDFRRAGRSKARAETLRAITFEKCADAYIDSHVASWKNKKHAAQWKSTLKTYAFPEFGSLPVALVDTTLVLKALEPIWKAKPETASRVRGRIESVLDWARVREFRDGENPARWRGHLDKLLPHRSDVSAVKHHAALNYDALPSFMKALRDEAGISARALEFCILTCTRSGETLGVLWHEVDIAGRLWRIPPERMKGRREHRVPLSSRALDILAEMKEVRTGRYVFPGKKADKPLSGMAMLMLLRRMGREDLTAHGFRSTFRDWAAEQSSAPNEVAEMALAHAVSNKVEAAYRRGDLFDRRRALAEEWAAYCCGP
jgi:integrase